MLAVGAIQVLILLIGLARAKFLSFAIGTAGYGLVGTVDQIIITMVSVGSLGLPFVALKMLSRSQSESQEQFERAYAGFFAALFSLGLLTAVIGVAITMVAPEVFGSHLAHYRLIIGIAIVAVPSLMINILLANSLAASRFGRRAALFTLLVQAVLLAGTVFGAVSAGVIGIYVATVAGGSILTIGASIALRRTLGSPLSEGFSWLINQIRRDRTILVYAFWSYASVAVYALSLSGLRTSLFSNDGAAAAGLLSAAMNLALTVGAVINPISNLMLTPHLNRAIPFEQKVSAANDFALRMLAVIVLVSLPMVLFPRLVMRLLFAPSFLEAAPILFAFVVWQCLAQAVNVLTQLLIGLDDFAFSCGATILGNALVFALAPWITARMDLTGAAALLIGGAAVCGIVSTIRLSQKFGTRPDRVAVLRLAFALAAISGSVFVARTSPEMTAIGFAVRAVYGIVCVLLLAALLNPAERAWLASFTSREAIITGG